MAICGNSLAFRAEYDNRNAEVWKEDRVVSFWCIRNAVQKSPPRCLLLSTYCEHMVCYIFVLHTRHRDSPYPPPPPPPAGNHSTRTGIAADTPSNAANTILSGSNMVTFSESCRKNLARRKPFQQGKSHCFWVAPRVTIDRACAYMGTTALSSAAS